MINDVTPTWGGGVARQAARRYPAAQASFRKRCSESDDGLALGNTAMILVGPDAWLAPIVAQHGLGYSVVPRIRYAALDQSLRSVAAFARKTSAMIRMPRIGAGGAGGRWARIAKTVERHTRGVRVEVFDLPKPLRNRSD